MTKHKEPTHQDWAKRFWIACGNCWHEVSYNGEDGTWVDKLGFIFHRNPNYDFTINAATLIEVMKEKDYYFDFLQFANTVMRDLTGLWLYPRLLCKRFLEWDWNK